MATPDQKLNSIIKRLGLPGVWRLTHLGETCTCPKTSRATWSVALPMVLAWMACGGRVVASRTSYQ